MIGLIKFANKTANIKYKKNLPVYNTVYERRSHTSKTTQIIFLGTKMIDIYRERISTIRSCVSRIQKTKLKFSFISVFQTSTHPASRCFSVLF